MYKLIKNRFEELGVEDWFYAPGRFDINSVPSKYGKKENYVNYIFNS